MSIDGAAPIRAKIKEIVPEYSYRLHRQPKDYPAAYSAGGFPPAGGPQLRSSLLATDPFSPP
ncbi:MAG TPA: hypothetical protein VKE24_03540, partial [Candidatus Acidoferrales bacterium]|nr:hypothetical protein [Candidatus Acidoferrales bacterium]